MTAVDHAELKRLDEAARPWTQGNTDLLRAIALDQNIKDWFENPTMPEFLLSACNRLDALLSEIEGLKAERDAWKKAVAAAQNADAENDAHLRSLLRTQAPDSWRPDKEAAEIFTDIESRHGLECIPDEEIVIRVRAFLRPQTAEIGK